METRVLILGASGLLGRALLRQVPPGVRVLAPSPEELPLEDRDGLRRYLREGGAHRLLLLAAWTAVDACEADPERAYLMNGLLPGLAAWEAARRNIPITYLSTDYVFDGQSNRPYQEHDPARPLSIYARSKWEGECRVREAAPDHRVIRSSGLYGSGGPDFVSTVLEHLRQGAVEVVTDEVNAPTYVDHLAPAVWTITLGELPGTWHVTASGSVSRFDFAVRLAELAGFDSARVRPTTHAVLGRPAPRPPYSVLDCQAARDVFGIALPSWEEGLAAFLNPELRASGSKNRPRPEATEPKPRGPAASQGGV